MNSIQKEFIHVLRDYINNQKTEYVVSPELLSYAKSQEVGGIIYRQTKTPSLQPKYAHSIYMQQNRNQLVNEVDRCLASYSHFYVKGLVIAQYYPDPGLRTMSDVDLIVREEDLANIKEKLVEFGFKIYAEVESVTVVSKGDFEFEIHTSLIHSGIGNEKAKEYFSHCWDCAKDNILDKSYHFIFCLQHLKGHMISEGVGFRQFTDIALFSKDSDLNWNWITEELPKIDLLDFAKTVFSFNKRWFNVDPPIEVPDIDNEFFDVATEKIFVGGVFGHDDETNQNMGIVKQAINGNSGINDAQRKYLLKQLFPNYMTMCTLPYCSYIKKSKSFLPIAWIHRMFYRGFNKKSRDGFKNRTTMNDKLQERMDLLKQWGL